MDIFEDLIVPYNKQIIGSFSEQWKRVGTLWTRIKLRKDGKEVEVCYLLVEASTSYNMLIGWPCLNVFDAIVSTLHLVMKFLLDKGGICPIHFEKQIARDGTLQG